MPTVHCDFIARSWSRRLQSPSRAGSLALLALAAVLGGCPAADQEGPVRLGPSRETATPDAGKPGGGRAGGETPATEAPPWLGEAPDCPGKETMIYVTGLILDMATGETVCDRSTTICGDSMKSEIRYDYRTASCPWAHGSRAAIFFSEQGPKVCCRAWEEARESKLPCDPLVDADCDGIANEDDIDLLTPTAPLP